MQLLMAATMAFSLAAGCAGQPRGGADEAAAPPLQQGPDTVTVELTPAEPSAAAGEEHAAAAEPAAGGITVRGTLSAPNPCQRLSAEVDADGGEVVLRVLARSDPDAMCAQVIASLGYTAEVRGLAPGTYTLRVVHAYPDSGWDEHTALTTQVAVR